MSRQRKSICAVRPASAACVVRSTSLRRCAAMCVIGVASALKRAPPSIVVVGRPNVGKSTIANRLTQKFGSGAIVHDEPGVTRDRTYGYGWWGSHEFAVVDTGGIVFDDDSNQVFMPQIRQQALVALGSASVALMVVDGQCGCTTLDEEIAAFLRKLPRVPVVLAVNKCESTVSGDLLAADFWQLGVGTPFPVSGIHGTGMGDLLDELVAGLPEETLQDQGEADELRVAILGKPNVGKSSLLNRLAGAERAIVSDVAGTTRDVIDQQVRRNSRSYVFLDTAGVRRAVRVRKGLEEMMVQRSLKAARRADVCLLLLDATEGVSDQEIRLAQFAADAGRACVIVVNKWDAVDGKTDQLYRNSLEYVQRKLPMLSWATQLHVSAKTGFKTAQIFEAIDAAAKTHRRRVSTSAMNEVLEDAVRWQRPPSDSKGRQGSIYYCAQVSTQPPTIVIFCNDPSLFSQSYKRYLEGQVRMSLGFEGSPIRFIFRPRRAREVMSPGGTSPYSRTK